MKNNNKAPQKLLSSYQLMKVLSGENPTIDERIIKSLENLKEEGLYFVLSSRGAGSVIAKERPDLFAQKILKLAESNKGLASEAMQSPAGLEFARSTFDSGMFDQYFKKTIDHEALTGFRETILKSYVMDLANQKKDVGDFDLLEEIIENISNENRAEILEQKDDQGNTPLICAASNKQIGMVKVLLNHGANPNHQNNFKRSALFYSALVTGNKEMAKTLLEKGADADLQVSPDLTAILKDDDGKSIHIDSIDDQMLLSSKIELTRSAGKKSIADFALERGHQEIASLINGHKTSKTQNNNPTPPQKTSQNSRPTNNLAESKNLGFSEEEITSFKKDQNKSMAALSKLASNFEKADEKEVLSKAKQLSQILKSFNSAAEKSHLNFIHGDKSPLMRAAFEGNHEMVKLLLQEGANPNFKDHGDRTAAFWAVIDNKAKLPRDHKSSLQPKSFENKKSIIESLVEKGAALDLEDKAGKTVINWTDKEDEKLKTFLTELNSKPSTQKAGDLIPLDQKFAFFQAAAKGDVKFLKEFFSSNKKINPDTLEEGTGRNALAYAALNGRTEAVKFLLEKGADPKLPDKNGQNAIDFAKQHLKGNPKSQIVEIALGEKTTEKSSKKTGKTFLEEILDGGKKAQEAVQKTVKDLEKYLRKAFGKAPSPSCTKATAEKLQPKQDLTRV